MFTQYQLKGKKGNTIVYKNQVFEVGGKPVYEQGWIEDGKLVPGEIAGELKKNGVTFIIKNADCIDADKLKYVKVIEKYSDDLVICETFDKVNEKTFEDIIDSFDENKIARLCDKNNEHSPEKRIPQLEQIAKDRERVEKGIGIIPFEDFNSMERYKRKNSNGKAVNIIEEGIKHFNIEKDYLEKLNSKIRFVAPDQEGAVVGDIYDKLYKKMQEVDIECVDLLKDMACGRSFYLYYATFQGGDDCLFWAMYKSAKFKIDGNSLPGMSYVFSSWEENMLEKDRPQGNYLSHYFLESAIELFKKVGKERIFVTPGIFQKNLGRISKNLLLEMDFEEKKVFSQMANKFLPIYVKEAK